MKKKFSCIYVEWLARKPNLCSRYMVIETWSQWTFPGSSSNWNPASFAGVIWALFSERSSHFQNLTFECLPHPILLCLWNPHNSRKKLLPLTSTKLSRPHLTHKLVFCDSSLASWQQLEQQSSCVVEGRVLQKFY